MNSVKTPLAALLAIAILSSFVAGCSALSQDGGGDGAAPSEQSYEAPPPPPSEDKES